MSGGETQQTVGEWIDATFPGTDPESPRKAIRALEEMVELCIASGASPREIQQAVVRSLNCCAEWQPQDGREFLPETIKSEAADVVIVLYGVAHMRGFDLHAEINRKMAVNRSRQWKALGDGTGYHIRSDKQETT